MILNNKYCILLKIEMINKKNIIKIKQINNKIILFNKTKNYLIHKHRFKKIIINKCHLDKTHSKLEFNVILLMIIRS